MGLIGSLHCAGMCGPLACALPMHNQDKSTIFFKTTVYHLSRIGVYGLMGIALGLIGGIVFVLSVQKYLLFISAAIFLILGFAYIVPNAHINAMQIQLPFSAIARKYWNKAARLSGIKGYIALGLVNGIIPCGLVYTALAVALFSGSVIKSGTYMVVFGLGTLPLMLALSAGAGISAIKFKNKIKKLYPFIFILIGTIMLFRALQIQLPYGLNLWDSLQNPVMCH